MNKDRQLAFGSVLKDFTDYALTFSTGSNSCTVYLIGGYNISFAETYRHGRVALCGFNGLKWIPWEIPEDSG